MDHTAVGEGSCPITVLVIAQVENLRTTPRCNSMDWWNPLVTHVAVVGNVIMVKIPSLVDLARFNP